MNITRSSGNVFEDLGFDPGESRVLKLRSSLMIAIKGEMKKRQLNQTQAAKLFGVTQPRISDLKRGKIDLFTIESLIEMLARACVPVSLIVDAYTTSVVSQGSYKHDLQPDQTVAISGHVPATGIGRPRDAFGHLDIHTQHGGELSSLRVNACSIRIQEPKYAQETIKQ